MHTEILLFHPSLATSTVHKALADAVIADGRFSIRDMYSVYPDRQIDVAAEQKLLVAADRIVLEYPMHWYAGPSLLQQWFNDVFAYEWAYDASGPRSLKGKQLRVAISAAGEAHSFTHSGEVKHTVDELLYPVEATASYVGMTYAAPFVLYGSAGLKGEALAAAAADYLTWLANPAE
ncbi:MAG: NAD(P)H-dependent oxidoreductase [Actinomycetaceae bacterium]|nr:NAD(P)H-dependent oxidoreductase [Actinomycetaceae bacterium]MDU0969602.1 NAD(P)H-dependent oxidoreductase [Actinomycetaceae bacterium]